MPSETQSAWCTRPQKSPARNVAEWDSDGTLWLRSPAPAESAASPDSPLANSNEAVPDLAATPSSQRTSEALAEQAPNRNCLGCGYGPLSPRPNDPNTLGCPNCGSRFTPQELAAGQVVHDVPDVDQAGEWLRENGRPWNHVGPNGSGFGFRQEGNLVARYSPTTQRIMVQAPAAAAAAPTAVNSWSRRGVRMANGEPSPDTANSWSELGKSIDKTFGPGGFMEKNPGALSKAVGKVLSARQGPRELPPRRIRIATRRLLLPTKTRR